MSSQAQIAIPSYTNLKQEKTAWVFLLAAATDPDERHLLDLTYCLDGLLSLGVSTSDIFIFADIEQSLNKSINNFLTLNNTKFNINGSLDDFIKLNSSHYQNFNNMLFFVIGHGNEIGLDSFTPLKPYPLVNKIKSFDNIKNAVLYLGQCYAGIFNYLEVGSNGKNLNLSIIGATELHSSLSMPIQNIKWSANLFFVYLFNWFRTPFDIDGDGKYSILDSYKYTEYWVNNYLKKFSENMLHEYMELYTQKSKLQTEIKCTNSKSKKNELFGEIAAIESKMKNKISLFTENQESWLLNANHTRTIGF